MRPPSLSRAPQPSGLLSGAVEPSTMHLVHRFSLSLAAYYGFKAITNSLSGRRGSRKSKPRKRWKWAQLAW